MKRSLDLRVLPLLLLVPSACDSRGADSTASTPQPASPAVEAKAVEVKAPAVEAEAVEVKAVEAKAAAEAKGEPGAAAKMLAAVDQKATGIAGIVDRVSATAAGTATDVAAVVADTTSTGPSVDLTDFYWVEESDAKGRLDAIDIGEELVALAEKYEAFDSLPAEATLPPGFTRGGEWVIMAADGEHRGHAEAFVAELGASEGHFIVTLDVPATGLAVRADDWSRPVPRLRDAKPVDLTAEPGKALLDAMRPGLAAAAEGPAKARLGGKRLGPEHLRVVEGHFPRGFTHLVALTVRAKSAEIGDEHVAGLLLADTTGRVEAVLAPHLTIDAYTVVHLVDLQGDGQDEVVWESSYYEGSYLMLTAWDAAGARVDRTLCGDGA